MLETLELSESVNSADLVTFNIYISGYGPPIEVNPIGVVQKFHQYLSDQNSAVFVLYPWRYIQISGAFRIYKHC
jgi:hypothetical protein